MPDLNFKVESAQAVPFAASPTLMLKLAIVDAESAEGGPTPIQTVALRCQVRIEPGQRRYTPQEQERLLDLFGQPHRWSQTLRSMLWTHAAVMVPAFAGSTSVELPLPCTFDFNVAATKYFDALESGDVPLTLLFSGTMFHPDQDGAMQAAPINWEKEATFRLPVRVWRDMMDHYYPNMAWLCLHKDVFDQLNRYKSRHSIPTWEQAIEQLLNAPVQLGNGPQGEL